jgi:hypothetical protein
MSTTQGDCNMSPKSWKFLSEQQQQSLEKFFSRQEHKPESLWDEYWLPMLLVASSAGLMFLPPPVHELAGCLLFGVILGHLAAIVLPWWTLTPPVLGKVKLDIVFTRNHWNFAFGSNFRHLVHASAWLCAAICLLATNHTNMACMALIGLVMSMEYVHRWRMVLRYRLAEIET